MATDELSAEEIHKLKQFSHALPDEQDKLDQLKNVDIDAIVDATGVTRRNVLQVILGLAAGGVVGGLSAQEVVQAVEADASTTDSDGNVGLPGDRVDVYADGIDSNSVGTEEVNSTTNLTKKVEDGQYTDMLAAIDGEAGDDADLFIEPGSYDVSTAITLADINNVAIRTTPRGSKWNQNTFPVTLNWTGPDGADMITVDAATQEVEGFSFVGIDFDGNESGAGTGAARAINFVSDGNQNRDHRFQRCGFQHFDGRAIERTGTNTGEVYDFEFQGCSFFKNNSPVEIPSQSELFNCYGVANASDGAEYGIECSSKVQVYGWTGAPQNGATSIKHQGQGVIIPANIEGDGSTGSAGLEIHSSVSVPAGTIQNPDIGIEIGDPNDSSVGGAACFIGGVLIQNTNTRLRFNGGNNNHNGCTVLRGRIRSGDMAFPNSDTHQMTVLGGLELGGVSASDAAPGYITYDDQNSRLIIGDGDGSGVTFSTDGTL